LFRFDFFFTIRTVTRFFTIASSINAVRVLLPLSAAPATNVSAGKKEKFYRATTYKLTAPQL
jgi:hypothetical protein